MEKIYELSLNDNEFTVNIIKGNVVSVYKGSTPCHINYVGVSEDDEDVYNIFYNDIYEYVLLIWKDNDKYNGTITLCT